MEGKRQIKTLDEVIKAIDFCKSGDLSKCKDCPYIDTCELDYAVLSADALHYLKVLKDILDPLKVKKITHEITCPQCQSKIAIFLPESNEPLTWNELKAMKGKPVWIEDNLETPEDIKKYWAIMRRTEKAESEEYALLSEFYYEKSQYEIDWIAYRKER